jgi:hypothetical protein
MRECEKKTSWPPQRIRTLHRMYFGPMEVDLKTCKILAEAEPVIRAWRGIWDMAKLSAILIKKGDKNV